MTLIAIDGRDLRRDEALSCDVVVVGSGPGGAVAAADLAAAGANVVVVEEGAWVQPHEFPADSIEALALLYRDAGLATTRGRFPIPVLQGRAVGGTSVVNSAICWRLPRNVYEEWTAHDPALVDALPWERLERSATEIERLLNVGPTDTRIEGRNNRLMARGAEALGLAHQPTNRNVSGCRGSARCNQGCPAGAKLSMDRTVLPRAVARGTRIVSSVRVEEIRMTRGIATGVTARAAGGARVRVLARRAVVLAAGATNTPSLLLANRVRHGPVGRRFQCHPGVAVAGRFPEPVASWSGATQGHEITEFMDDGIKLESVAFDTGLLAARLDGIGARLAADIEQLQYCATWAAAIRARALGSVTNGRRRPRVTMPLTVDDMRRVRRAVGLLGELMFAAGATEVIPGVAGWHARVTDAETMSRFEHEGPIDPRAYSFAISHMFGTCALGSDPTTSVVRPDLRHHAVDRLYVSDASVFPTNLGVNPQISIMTMAKHCAASIIASPPGTSSEETTTCEIAITE